LEDRHPDLRVELLGLSTEGDRITDRPLAEVGGKGLFLKELQQALLSKKADIAVHSAKDVPVEDIPGLSYVAYCQRIDPRDVLIAKNHLSFADLPKGAIVGTSSYRRRAQLLLHRPDLVIKDLRGNDPGDHYVHIKIQTPTTMTKKQKELLEAFKQEDEKNESVFKKFKKLFKN
jgi:hydroxymethylbilane synthase